jgi:hypothetical protein
MPATILTSIQETAKRPEHPPRIRKDTDADRKIRRYPRSSLLISALEIAQSA